MKISIGSLVLRHKLLNLTKVVTFSLSVFTLNAFAAIETSTTEEINHLLEFVAVTDCKYERNGSMHNGLEAIKHIEKKYAYFSDDIKSAEDFIKHSATKSYISSKYYKIHCKNKEVMKSKDWLLNELKAFRALQK